VVTEELSADSDDRADEDWLLSAQRKLDQCSTNNPDSCYRELWNWVTELRNLRCAWRKTSQREVEQTAWWWSSARSEEDRGMAKKARNEAQILRLLHQAESGERVADIFREHGVSEATFYVWKKKYGGLALNEPRELRQLREENGKLKRLVAELSLDRHMLQEIVRKSCKAPAAA
jgi:putative transposase